MTGCFNLLFTIFDIFFPTEMEVYVLVRWSVIVR